MNATPSRRQFGAVLAGGAVALLSGKVGAQTSAADAGVVEATRYRRQLMSMFPPALIVGAQVVAESEGDAERIWGTFDDELNDVGEEMGATFRIGRELEAEELQDYGLDRGVLLTFDGVGDGDPFEAIYLSGTRDRSVYGFLFATNPRDDDGMPAAFQWFMQESIEFGLWTADIPQGFQEYGPTGGTVEQRQYDVTSDSVFELPDLGTPVATPEEGR